jgi:hypothetical protein
MNYATRRMVELQMRLPGEIADRSATRAELDDMSDLALQCQSKLRLQIFGRETISGGPPLRLTLRDRTST